MVVGSKIRTKVLSTPWIESPIRPDFSKMAEKEINIQDHILAPKHTIIDEKEAEELLVKYNISKRQLPQVRIKDPAIKNLNAKPGDIIKIIRKSPVQGKSVFYRVVIE